MFPSICLPPATRRYSTPACAHPSTRACTPQVAAALARPSSPDVAKHLRAAATAIGAERDTSRWLDTDLVPNLLSILRSLPAGRSAGAATAVCAAALSALAHMFIGLEADSANERRFRAMLVADPEACGAVVRWGLTCPEGTAQLPAGQEVNMPHDHAGVPEAASKAKTHPFWTPFACVISFVTMVALPAQGCSAEEHRAFMANFRAAATPAVVAHLLKIAKQYPCRTRPQRPPYPPSLF
jgi:hypothetical protein